MNRLDALINLLTNLDVDSYDGEKLDVEEVIMNTNKMLIVFTNGYLDKYKWSNGDWELYEREAYPYNV